MTVETARRLGFALAVGAAFAASPLTSGRRILPSLIGGVVAAGAVLAVRRPREPLSFRLSTPTRASCLMLAATVAAAGVAFAPVLIELFREYTQSIWKNAHGLLFPFLIWEMASARLRRIQGAMDPSAWGFVPALAGLLMVVVDSGLGTLQISTVGMVLFAWGSSFLILGSSRARALAMPFALCLFLVPLSTSLAALLGLPRLSTWGAAWLLELFGNQPVLVGRYLILQDTLAYGVSNNCSGFSTFIAALAAASFFAAHTRSRARALLLLAAPWPLVVAANSLRCAALVAVAERFALPIAQTPLDGFSGIATFWLVMGVLFLIADRDGLREKLM